MRRDHLLLKNLRACRQGVNATDWCSRCGFVWYVWKKARLANQRMKIGKGIRTQIKNLWKSVSSLVNPWWDPELRNREWSATICSSICSSSSNHCGRLRIYLNTT